MSYSRYDFEGLWFSIYRKVLKHNETLGEEALDKSQLREVCTSIFISQTQRGIVKPLVLNSFMKSVMSLINNVKDRKAQETVYKTISDIVKNGKNKVKIT